MIEVFLKLSSVTVFLTAIIHSKFKNLIDIGRFQVSFQKSQIIWQISNEFARLSSLHKELTKLLKSKIYFH